MHVAGWAPVLYRWDFSWQEKWRLASLAFGNLPKLPNPVGKTVTLYRGTPSCRQENRRLASPAVGILPGSPEIAGKATGM